MQKIVTGAVLVGVIGAAGWYFFSTQVVPHTASLHSPTAPRATPISNHFKNELLSVASSKLGSDVSSSDANLLITVFPGFKETDFVSVVTKQGMYELRVGSLALVSAGTGKATGVESMIADGGYLTLLHNTASRLNMSADSIESVNAVIEALKKGE